MQIIEQLAKQSLDVHCHGIGRFDFTEILEIELQEIENRLASSQRRVILTLYLPKMHFNAFLRMMDAFASGKESGKYKHIEGISLEGPLLASHGGTPNKGVWNPTKAQWKQLAECGKKGLIYVICSPDADLDPKGNTSLDAPANSVIWIAETLLEGGVLPAAGHFTRKNPLAIAKVLQSVYDVVTAWGHGPTITDHLYNDMPRNFNHAWRTKDEKIKRAEEIQSLNLNSWTLDNLEQKIGPVPATMMRNALKGHVKMAINCDGEHVDLAIVQKTIELVGAENLIMITDSIESKCLAGRNLHMPEGSTLLYQDEGIVAAGSQGVARQIENLLSIGLNQHEVTLMTNTVPTNIISGLREYHENKAHSF